MRWYLQELHYNVGGLFTSIGELNACALLHLMFPILLLTNTTPVIQTGTINALAVYGSSLYAEKFFSIGGKTVLNSAALTQ